MGNFIYYVRINSANIYTSVYIYIYLICTPMLCYTTAFAGMFRKEITPICT